jgi:hypothetical protein
LETRKGQDEKDKREQAIAKIEDVLNKLVYPATGFPETYSDAVEIVDVLLAACREEREGKRREKWKRRMG